MLKFSSLMHNNFLQPILLRLIVLLCLILAQGMATTEAAASTTTPSSAEGAALLLSFFMDMRNWLGIHDIWIRCYFVRWRLLPPLVYYLARTVHYTILLIGRVIYEKLYPVA
jgi:hypothetical protein